MSVAKGSVVLVGEQGEEPVQVPVHDVSIPGDLAAEQRKQFDVHNSELADARNAESPPQGRSIQTLVTDEVHSVHGGSPMTLLEVMTAEEGNMLEVAWSKMQAAFRAEVQAVAEKMVNRRMQQAEASTAQAISDSLDAVDRQHNVMAINHMVLSLLQEAAKYSGRLPGPVEARIIRVANQTWPTLMEAKTGYMARALGGVMTVLYGQLADFERYLRARDWKCPDNVNWRDPVAGGDLDLNSAVRLQASRDCEYFKNLIGA